MTESHTFGLIPVLVACAACASSRTGAADAASSGTTSPGPDPFAREYAGVYAPGDAGTVGAADLSPDGSLMWGGCAPAAPQVGAWLSPPGAHALPLELRLVSASYTARLTIATFDGDATLRCGEQSVALHPRGVVGPDERLCDASGGRWTDDDPDPATGLYCLCDQGMAYVPREGGCVMWPGGGAGQDAG